MREAIKNLKPYYVTNNEGYIRLDNNECFLNLIENIDLSKIQNELTINRYPSYSTELVTESYANYVGFPQENILVGNGSDEWISLICQYALNPSDTVMVVEPDFSMYGKNAVIMGADIVSIPLNGNFSLPLAKIIATIETAKPKLFFLSNPNNPTGKSYPFEQIEDIIDHLQKIDGILVLDEAYIEFAGKSFVSRLLNFENVIILRTTSKALGMAGLRLGFLLSSDKIISDMECIKPPYNVNIISAIIGSSLLKQHDLLAKSFALQMEQKEELHDILLGFSESSRGIILHPSETNYYLIETDAAKELAHFLDQKKIKIRYFGTGLLINALRISTGTKEEHQKLRIALKEWSELHAYSLEK